MTTALGALDIVTWTLAATVGVGAVAVVLLRLLSRSSLVVQVVVVALAAAGALVVTLAVAVQRMYVSASDQLVFAWFALVAVMMSVALAALLGASVLRNSRELVARARAVGDLDVRPTGRAAPLANEFAVIARELATSDVRLRESRAREARAESARRELVAWISHDLRTPLAGLRAMTEALADGVVDDPPTYHARMLAQVDRLGSMVDDLFQLSTLHAGTVPLRLRPLRAAELVDDLVSGLGPVAAARGVRLRADDVDDVHLEADPDELGRALANLVMNSVRLSPEGADVRIGVREPRHGAEVVFSVADSAGGIAESDLGRVFEAGWRATESRTPSTGGGAGLGLAIVQGIAAAHRGRVRVQNVGAGCRFDVIVPVGGVHSDRAGEFLRPEAARVARVAEPVRAARSA